MNLTSGAQAEFEIPPAQRQPLVQLYVLCKQMLAQQITRRELGLEKEKLERVTTNLSGLGPAALSGAGVGMPLPAAPPAIALSDGGSGIRENSGSGILGDASEVSAPSLAGSGLLESTLKRTSVRSLVLYIGLELSISTAFSA